MLSNSFLVTELVIIGDFVSNLKYSTSAWASIGVNKLLMGFLGITEQFVLTMELGIS